ncbi:MAG: beta-propeller fold lactonase family protein, partial [Sphaerochaeta sp.]
LVTNPSSTLLYAICKDSKNINVFTIDSINSRLSFLEATSLGSFIPTGAEISPDKENLLVVSDTSNAILICRIPH